MTEVWRGSGGWRPGCSPGTSHIEIAAASAAMTEVWRRADGQRRRSSAAAPSPSPPPSPTVHTRTPPPSYPRSAAGISPSAAPNPRAAPQPLAHPAAALSHRRHPRPHHRHTRALPRASRRVQHPSPKPNPLRRTEPPSNPRTHVGRASRYAAAVLPYRHPRAPFPVIPAPRRGACPRIRRPKLDLGPKRPPPAAQRPEPSCKRSSAATRTPGAANGVGHRPQIKFGATERGAGAAGGRKQRQPRTHRDTRAPPRVSRRAQHPTPKPPANPPPANPPPAAPPRPPHRHPRAPGSVAPNLIWGPSGGR